MNTILFPESRKRKMQEREEADFGPLAGAAIDPWEDEPQIMAPLQRPISIRIMDHCVEISFPSQDGNDRHAVTLCPELLSRVSDALLAAKQRFWPTDYVAVGEEERP